MKITPYLTFNGTCRKALTFYAELFDGKVDSFSTWNKEDIEHIPEATTDHIMHGSISIDGQTISGTDQFGAAYMPAGNVSLMVDLDDLSDAEAKFNALAKGGQIIMPFGGTFWAEGYGFCTDRFGIAWQVNCTGNVVMAQ